jgi:hypothetical protein
LFKKFGAAIQKRGRLDLAGVEVQFQRKRARKSEMDDLLQENRKNLFRTLSRSETESC